MDLLAPIKSQLHKLWGTVEKKAEITLGVVAQESPLLVQLDGDVDSNGDPVTTPAQSLTALTVGQRVVCAETFRRVIVIATD